MFEDLYRGKRVLVTGHTGFKGSWLCAWLLELGAQVIGYSLDVPTRPSNFEVLGLVNRMDHRVGDTRDRSGIEAVMRETRPEMVFHLAAQALVRRAFDRPAETFETNALGTMNVLEAIRSCPSVRSGVFITSDKCYRNLEWSWGYRETDQLGGEDPYSASKGCAELIIYSYIHSFFQNGPAVASTRAGNVIGGGDWAEDRIVPDAVRAWSRGNPLFSRNPSATRPWQHVLEPLSGYLHLGARLWQNDPRAVGQAYNFGPDALVNQSVGDLLTAMTRHWPGAVWKSEQTAGETKKESTLLKLCCDKALHGLDWHAVLEFEETVRLTTDWYKAYYESGQRDMAEITRSQIRRYVDSAGQRGLSWAG